jgi:hypothetical protein
MIRESSDQPQISKLKELVLDLGEVHGDVFASSLIKFLRPNSKTLTRYEYEGGYMPCQAWKMRTYLLLLKNMRLLKHVKLTLCTSRSWCAQAAQVTQMRACGATRNQIRTMLTDRIQTLNQWWINSQGIDESTEVVEAESEAEDSGSNAGDEVREQPYDESEY